MTRKPISFGRKLSRLVSAVSRLLAMFTAARLVMSPCLEFGGRAAAAWRAGASHRVPGSEPSKRAESGDVSVGGRALAPRSGVSRRREARAAEEESPWARPTTALRAARAHDRRGPLRGDQVPLAHARERGGRALRVPLAEEGERALEQTLTAFVEDCVMGLKQMGERFIGQNGARRFYSEAFIP